MLGDVPSRRRRGGSRGRNRGVRLHEVHHPPARHQRRGQGQDLGVRRAAPRRPARRRWKSSSTTVPSAAGTPRSALRRRGSWCGPRPRQHQRHLRQRRPPRGRRAAASARATWSSSARSPCWSSSRRRDRGPGPPPRRTTRSSSSASAQSSWRGGARAAGVRPQPLPPGRRPVAGPAPGRPPPRPHRERGRPPPLDPQRRGQRPRRPARGDRAGRGRRQRAQAPRSGPAAGRGELDAAGSTSARGWPSAASPRASRSCAAASTRTTN